MGFRDKFARFMYGRYGADQLYNALFIGEVVLLFAATVLGLIGSGSGNLVCRIISYVLYAAAMGLMAFALYRFFSRNYAARRRENALYLRVKDRLSFWKKGVRTNKQFFMDTDQHIFRQCPYCKSTLRLPRQKGKHTVKCPRCAKSFTVKVRK